MSRCFALVPALVVLVGCEELTGSDPTSATPATTTTPTDDGAGGGKGGNGGGRKDDDRETPEPGTAPAAGWTVTAHPCFGNRTDAMWFDDRDTVWVGCGSTTEGTGLYRSDDGGATWATITGFFDTFRVSSISRAADGRLYVAGLDTTGPARVVSFGPANDLVEEFSAGDQVWSSFHVGTFRRDAAGRAVAESLTGTEVVVRDGDAGAWTDGADWDGTAGSYQILDLELHDDAFYGVGSTISQPPTIYLPLAGDGLAMAPLEFTGFDGEFWDLAVDDAGLLAAGVNQDRDTGFLAWSGPDAWDLDGYGTFDVSTLIVGEPTWMRGACRSGDTLVAVGEYSMEGTGLVIRSVDGGATWSDLTPAGVPSLHRCELLDDGALAVAGAEGTFAVYVD